MSANVPDADTLVRLLSAWGTISSTKFHRAYPFFEADRRRAIEEYRLVNDDRAALEATALVFSEYADDIYAKAIEARRAETQSGSVADESAAPKGFARKDSMDD